MKLYKHSKSGRIMSYDEWKSDEARVKACGGEIFDVDARIEMGILEPYKMPYGIPYPGIRKIVMGA